MMYYLDKKPFWPYLAILVLSLLAACKNDIGSTPPEVTQQAIPSQTLKNPEVVTLNIDHKIAQTAFQVEVANSPNELMTGLMNRDSLPENQGMLFVFDQPMRQCFWMKNTRIPLSIAFLNEKHEIIQITDMQPQTLDEHCADHAMYTIEMNQGWFARHHVQAGQKVLGITQTFEP